MSALIPTAAERASLEFTVPKLPFGLRYLVSAALIVLGTVITFAGPGSFGGLVVVALGHVPLWVRKQRLAPGGATPVHEDNWAPVDSDWLERVRRLERAGAAWDLSPWDITSKSGCGTLLLVFVVTLGGAILAVSHLGAIGLPSKPMAYIVVLLAPIWWNGRRNAWHPSELLLKGDALEVAAEKVAGEPWEVVHLLALREGKTGLYPVDARLMLRPTWGEEADTSDFIGIQVQVSLNNVRGRRYPYLYAVVLAKRGFRFPRLPALRGMVLEKETRDNVTYVVVRQYADNSGGWHTDAHAIDEIVNAALSLGDRCRH